MVLKFVNQRGSTVSTPFVMGAPKLPVGFVQKAISPSSSERSQKCPSRPGSDARCVILRPEGKKTVF